MQSIHLVLENESKTQAFAQKLAEKINAGTVIGLIGQLGSGKTTFTQALGKSLGVKDKICSPTFKLVSEYNGEHFRFYHIDCYRLENEKDFFNIGGENYLDPSDGVTVIEWADKLGKILPRESIIIELKNIKNEPDKRELIITGILI